MYVQADVDIAVNAAKVAFQPDSEWCTMDASARGKLIYKLAELIEKHKNHLANLESLDNGKPFSDSFSDVEMAIATLQYYAGFADKIHGKTISTGTYTSTDQNINPSRILILFNIY